MDTLDRNPQRLFTVTGFICLLVAVWFGVMTETRERESTSGPSTTKSVSSHPASWGASEGFAIAGGLCFLAAGLVHRNITERAPQEPPPGVSSHAPDTRIQKPPQ
jgi:hypothetical protein